MSLPDFLRDQLADSTSPLVVVGERVLTAELPAHVQASTVLRVVGSGQVTYSTIALRGGVPAQSLARTLTLLTDTKRLVQVQRPLSSRPSRLSTYYTIADPYLRFWLRFVDPLQELISRGRGALAAEQVLSDWPTYRGTAVEPLVRESLARLLPRPEWPGGLYVGAWWDRQQGEVDIVVADKQTSPVAVAAVGSIKWRERSPFDRGDLDDLKRLCEPACREPLPRR